VLAYVFVLFVVVSTPELFLIFLSSLAASLKRDADAVLLDPSLTLQQRAAFR
jgi:hypothetical protein